MTEHMAGVESLRKMGGALLRYRRGRGDRVSEHMAGVHFGPRRRRLFQTVDAASSSGGGLVLVEENVLAVADGAAGLLSAATLGYFRSRRAIHSR